MSGIPGSWCGHNYAKPWLIIKRLEKLKNFMPDGLQAIREEVVLGRRALIARSLAGTWVQMCQLVIRQSAQERLELLRVRICQQALDGNGGIRGRSMPAQATRITRIGSDRPTRMCAKARPDVHTSPSVCVVVPRTARKGPPESSCLSTECPLCVSISFNV